MLETLCQKPGAGELDLENNQLLQEAKRKLFSDLDQKRVLDLSILFRICHKLNFKDEGLINSLKRLIFDKYYKLEDYEISNMIETFMIFIQKFELSLEEIDIIKNMLGRNSSKFTVTHALELTELFQQKNLTHIRDQLYEYHLFLVCWKKMKYMSIEQLD